MCSSQRTAECFPCPCRPLHYHTWGPSSPSLVREVLKSLVPWRLGWPLPRALAATSTARGFHWQPQLALSQWLYCMHSFAARNRMLVCQI